MRNFRQSNEDHPERLIKTVQNQAARLDSSQDLDSLVDAVGDARCVMLGEASHGTSEFYTWRAQLSTRLLREKGFRFIAVEGDWPDCYQVNRYIKGYENAGSSAQKVLFAFDRWPTWMWSNYEVVALAEGLRQFNERTSRKVGFYGLDVYSLWESMRAITGYLQNKDPELVKLAHQAYRCFEPYAEDVQAYAWSTRMVPDTCEDEVLDLLRQMQEKSPVYDGDPEAGFNAEQNALVMVNAEKYYRAMVSSDLNSWNVRDIHMADTLERLMQHHGEDSKTIVWAHNTHVGDARFTDMASAGMTNLGQLMRERLGEDQVFLVGFGTHHGTVIAAEEWNAPMQVMGVPDAVIGSWEHIFHQASANGASENFYLLLEDLRSDEGFARERGHRAIGVVYHPNYERSGNYVPTRLPHRYDAFIYLDETQALHPMHVKEREAAPVPETFPWGL